MKVWTTLWTSCRRGLDKEFSTESLQAKDEGTAVGQRDWTPRTGTSQDQPGPMRQSGLMRRDQ